MFPAASYAGGVAQPGVPPIAVISFTVFWVRVWFSVVVPLALATGNSKMFSPL
jgi:hypothetical protein